MRWDDEYLTVNEIAERLKLNPQTVRNWIDQGRLPALRIGRRIRVRRADLDRVLQQSSTTVASAQSPGMAAEARAGLTDALEHARRLLGRRSAARRAELAERLQELADAVAAAIQLLSGNDHARDADSRPSRRPNHAKAQASR